MRLNTLVRIDKSARRLAEILATLAKYGLADWLSHVDIAFLRDLLKDQGGERLARQVMGWCIFLFISISWMFGREFACCDLSVVGGTLVCLKRSAVPPGTNAQLVGLQLLGGP